MISERDKKTLDEFAARLRERYPDARVLAFGSRARGDNEADSDFDICVVMDTLDRERNEYISEVLWEVGYENEVVIGTARFTGEQFDHTLRTVSPLIRTIREEGIAA